MWEQSPSAVRPVQPGMMGSSSQCPSTASEEAIRFRESSIEALAILAVQQIPHRSSPSLVRFRQGLALIGVHAPFGSGPSASGALQAGQRLAKPGLPGFSSNSSEQTAHTLMGKAISIL